MEDDSPQPAPEVLGLSGSSIMTWSFTEKADRRLRPPVALFGVACPFDKMVVVPGAHSNYPSRDARRIVVGNGGAVRVLDAPSLRQTAWWRIPGGVAGEGWPDARRAGAMALAGTTPRFTSSRPSWVA